MRQIRTVPGIGRLSCAALLLMCALLAAGCSATGDASGGDVSAIPTVTAPPSNMTAPAHQAITLVGSGAIKPHVSGIPAFTADDMKQYLLAHPIAGSDSGASQPSVTVADFLGCAEMDGHVGTAISSGLAGCGQGTRYGFILESGAFDFPGMSGGPLTSTASAFAVFDPATGNLLMSGTASEQKPAQNPTPTPGSGQPTPTPHVAFTMKPQSTSQTCTDSTTLLAPTTLTLDNTGSNVPVSWSAEISETVGTSGTVWASASPSSGTVPAGKTAKLVITPESKICSHSQTVVPDATYQVVVKYNSGQKLTFSDLVHSPIPG
jgi:hypothetical protein